jgi:hypothetical protein
VRPYEQKIKEWATCRKENLRELLDCGSAIMVSESKVYAIEHMTTLEVR